MVERTLRHIFANGAEEDRASDIGRAELASFFRELGLGWEVDAESLVDRLADQRGGQ